LTLLVHQNAKIRNTAMKRVDMMKFDVDLLAKTL